MSSYVAIPEGLNVSKTLGDTKQIILHFNLSCILMCHWIIITKVANYPTISTQLVQTLFCQANFHIILLTRSFQSLAIINWHSLK